MNQHILPVSLTALLALAGPLPAITGSWHFTGYRFEGSNRSPQSERADGSVVISEPI